MELIRTGLRNKLPKGLSYPLGAELISTLLANVPQYDELWISFSKSGWMSIEAIGGALGAASYMLSFSASLYFISPSYRLRVPAVPSEYRQTIRVSLIEYGLPKVRAWLVAPRPQTWCSGDRCIDVGIVPDTGATCFIETHNRRVVSFKKVIGSD